MEKVIRNLKDDVSDLKSAVQLLEYFSFITEDKAMLDLICRTSANLKILIYDLEEFVQCD